MNKQLQILSILGISMFFSTPVYAASDKDSMVCYRSVDGVSFLTRDLGKNSSMKLEAEWMQWHYDLGKELASIVYSNQKQEVSKNCFLTCKIAYNIEQGKVYEAEIESSGCKSLDEAVLRAIKSKRIHSFLQFPKDADQSSLRETLVFSYRSKGTQRIRKKSPIKLRDCLVDYPPIQKK